MRRGIQWRIPLPSMSHQSPPSPQRNEQHNSPDGVCVGCQALEKASISIEHTVCVQGYPIDWHNNHRPEAAGHRKCGPTAKVRISPKAPGYDK